MPEHKRHVRLIAVLMLCSLRKLKIKLVNPELRKQGLRLSYQQGYFAR
jgi:hypothetical protein